MTNGAINFDPGGLAIQGAGTCPGVTLTPPASPGPLIQRCVGQLHIRDVVAYQPGDRYWPFQCFELAIFLALTAMLVGLCFWWIRRRVN
jgi:hypothetical protein